MTRSRVPVLGVLLAGDRSYPSFTAFCEAIQDLGYRSGETIHIEARFAEGRLEQLPRLAADLARLGVDVIAVIGAVTYWAARDAAPDLPIIFAIVLDPVAARIVVSAQSPGGLTTGCTNFDPGQIVEQVRLLKRAAPGRRRLAVLGDAGVPDTLPRLAKAAAEAAGLDVVTHLLSGEDDVAPAFAKFAAANAGALLCLEVPRTTTYGARIVQLAIAARLPAIFGRDHARYGPLMAYGTSLAIAARQMASQVDMVLRGADAGRIPVEYVSKPELIINLDAARQMALTLPDDLLRSAHQLC